MISNDYVIEIESRLEGILEGAGSVANEFGVDHVLEDVDRVIDGVNTLDLGLRPMDGFVRNEARIWQFG